jgi:hypothetical protein
MKHLDRVGYDFFDSATSISYIKKVDLSVANMLRFDSKCENLVEVSLALWRPPQMRDLPASFLDVFLLLLPCMLLCVMASYFMVKSSDREASSKCKR